MVKNDKCFQTVSNIIMLFLCLLVVAPLLLLVMSSFTSESAIYQYGYNFWPKEFDLSAYQYLFREGSIFHSYLITIVVTLTGTVAGVLMTTLLAYALTVPELPGKGLITLYVLLTMLFSGGLVPSYMMWTKMFHIKNTLWALILPGLLCNGFNVMIARSYFVTNIPKELLESARVDGMTEFKIFAKIVIPISVPIVATLGFMQALYYWNDWQNSLYYITDSSLVGIQALLNNLLNDAQYLAKASALAGGSATTSSIPSMSTRMAIAVLGMLPMVCAYPFFQKYYVKGLTIGAVKG
ncbi:MAG: carbohydrate ABC transporter permease [Lachnospiraceae bacterium]|nr:carbohydrate ABC transporter permease [Lachnospiraceae bacterium]